MTGIEPVYAAIEAGGTKFRVARAHGRNVVADTTIPTTSPDETISAAIRWIRDGGPIAATGISCFGPLNLDPASSSYGSIATTPKPGWSNVPILERVRAALDVPSAIDVDVGGAALAEWRWGSARRLDHFVYVTIGTGIGGGVFVAGKVHHGLGHPELGHMTVERVAGDEYQGHCPFHMTCLEGMASGPAIGDRWGTPGETLTQHPEVWDLEATYLAQALRTLTYVLAPQRIVIGGGVMQQSGLLELLRAKLADQLNNYVTSDRLSGSLDDYVVSPEFGQDAGLIGAIALAMDAV